MPFKDMLKHLREERGLSQDELARLTQLSKSTISMYENGNREPKFETLEVIADFFNVDMNTLLDKKQPIMVLTQQEESHIKNTVSFQMYDGMLWMKFWILNIKNRQKMILLKKKKRF